MLQDEVVETLAQLEREGLPSDKQLKQLKKIGCLTAQEDSMAIHIINCALNDCCFGCAKSISVNLLFVY